MCFGAWTLRYAKSGVWATYGPSCLAPAWAVILFATIGVFLCHQPLVNHGGSRFYLLLLYSQPRHSQGHPVISLTKTEGKKKRRENLLATLRDSNLRDTEMAHIAREPLLQEATAMLSGKSPDKRQLCFLLACTETACIKVKALIDLSLGPQRRLWATARSCESTGPQSTVTPQSYLSVSLLAKFLKMSYTKVIKY